MDNLKPYKISHGDWVKALREKRAIEIIKEAQTQTGCEVPLIMVGHWDSLNHVENYSPIFLKNDKALFSLKKYPTARGAYNQNLRPRTPQDTFRVLAAIVLTYESGIII